MLPRRSMALDWGEGVMEFFMDCYLSTLLRKHGVKRVTGRSFQELGRMALAEIGCVAADDNLNVMELAETRKILRKSVTCIRTHLAKPGFRWRVHDLFTSLVHAHAVATRSPTSLSFEAVLLLTGLMRRRAVRRSTFVIDLRLKVTHLPMLYYVVGLQR